MFLIKFMFQAYKSRVVNVTLKLGT